MRTTPILAIVAALAALPAGAQTTGDVTDRKAIEGVAARWQDGWNRHDAAALAALLAEDVDFVTVMGPEGWLKGRKAFQEYHAEIHKLYFKDSVWRVKETQVRFVRPEVAVAQVLWETKGDSIPDRKLGDPRDGIFTWVLEKRDGKWFVVASQNTETRPPSAPRPATKNKTAKPGK